MRHVATFPEWSSGGGAGFDGRNGCKGDNRFAGERSSPFRWTKPGELRSPAK